MQGGARLEEFRRVFGDERADYAAALQAHYAKGDGGRGLSGMSAPMPLPTWEDWAETWAHYLHMVDLLETAASYQLGVTVPTPPFGPQPAMRHTVSDPLAALPPVLTTWGPVGASHLLLNSLNRSLGQSDAYPFAPVCRGHGQTAVCARPGASRAAAACTGCLKTGCY